jgi:hypothetical protein
LQPAFAAGAEPGLQPRNHASKLVARHLSVNRRAALVAPVKYAQTTFAQEVRALYDEGGLDDCSVRWSWRTEVTRNPNAEEVQKYGENLHWVCERADLVELSAVMLGADSGAQMIRGDVVEAFERCRSKNIALPAIEKLVRLSQLDDEPPFIDIDAVLADRKPHLERLLDYYLGLRR